MEKRWTDLHNCFADLTDFPERTPLLGYYKEEDPEVCDWEIKWAVEHGIGCFIYCWYRKRENVGQKITLDDLRLGHAIHEAYFHCRFKQYMKYAIMWECDWGLIRDFDDLRENLIPFWVDHYFSDLQYLMVDGKPVLYIYNSKNLIKLLGSEEAFGDMLGVIRQEILKYGFPGIHISVTHSNKQIHNQNQWHTPIEGVKKLGVDSTFQYCNQIAIEDLTQSQYDKYLETLFLDPQLVIEEQLGKVRDRIAFDPYFSMFTVSAMRDSRPWFPVVGIDPRKPIMQFRLSPMEFKELLIQVKALLDGLPKDAIGRKILIIDAWNEWSEGHYVAPCLENGFQYLQALREVLTHRDNLPDYRMPETLEFGSYEQE